MSDATAAKMPPARGHSHPHLAQVLFTPRQIAVRVARLAHEITRSHAAAGPSGLTLVAVANGALVFAADLLRHLPHPTRFDLVRVSTYHDATAPAALPTVHQFPRLDLHNGHVLLVDDILDTGHTLHHLQGIFRERYRPASLKTCVLLDKPARRRIAVNADFYGFQIPDHFVVGYGLDYAEHYRNLPCIGVLDPALVP
ncbi:MAG: hypoxanthine phosphoribosyltransferase [Puniceicoccales bacterium]|jgi:hypoxanthine phosphoribosyltransferase|nr:hypoxanthine phosphoribosyltransferase [Puniceicoccales bacterium]